MTCLETYATLRVFSDDLDPAEISEILGISPTDPRPRDLESRYKHERETSLWRWCTQHKVDSVDNLEHIHSVIEVLHGKKQALENLRNRRCSIDISSFWVSSGQGGPSLDAETMRALSDLGLEVWWDIYFGEESEYDDDA